MFKLKVDRQISSFLGLKDPIEHNMSLNLKCTCRMAYKSVEWLKQNARIVTNDKTDRPQLLSKKHKKMMRVKSFMWHI